MPSTLANKLTISRVLIIPPILLLLVIQQGWSVWLALVLFLAAAATDWLDGYVARRHKQITPFGIFLDPIADKLLVSGVILLLVYTRQITGLSILPAVIILLREVAVSGLREFLAGLKVSMPVSKLAKWKTSIQMAALTFLIVNDHTPDWFPAGFLGDWLLWIAGALTLITAWDYWQVGQKHFASH